MREMDARFGIETAHHRDARVMLDAERLDVVSICTWHTGHAPWTVTAAARRPKAILCEKPMAETLGRADEMLIACHRNGVKLVIGHQRRFLPAYTPGPRPHRPGGDRPRIAHGELRRPGAAQLLVAPDGHVPLPARRRGVPVGDGQRRAEDRPVRADDPDRGQRGGGVRVRARRAGADPGRRHADPLPGCAHLRHGRPDQPHHRGAPAPERRDAAGCGDRIGPTGASSRWPPRAPTSSGAKARRDRPPSWPTGSRAPRTRTAGAPRTATRRWR